jgi:hypothetical protein
VKLSVLSRTAPSDHSTATLHFITALIVGLSIVVVFFSYRINDSCLTIGLDGASWSTYLEYQHEDRQSFAQVGADPVQGNFDAYFPVSHEYLLSEAVTSPFSHATAGKAVNYFVYYLLMLAAFCFLVRSIDISWPMALLAANLFGVLGFPGLANLNSQTYGPFNFNPHIAQSIALSMFIVAAFWRLNPRRMNGPVWAVALIAIPSVCFLIDILSMGAQIIFILPATAVYGSASLLDVKNWRDDILRIVAAVLLVIVAWALGIIEYFYGLIGYSAYNFFSHEFVRFRFDSGDASTFWFSELGALTIGFGLMGAAWSFWFETGRARIFAATHIVATCAFIPVAYVIVHFANSYNGTMPARFEMFMWPYALVFSSIAIVQAVKSALQISRPFLKGRLQSLLRYGTPIALAASLAVIVAYNAGQALAHPGRQCPQSFSPIQATPITDVLRDNIAVRPGATFKGIVATIDGVKDKPSISWLDLHFHDYQVWQRTGNDHRLVGLWHFSIPTLFQYFAFTTPPYYLLLTEFLSRPEDKQFRSGLVLTRADEKMMRLWGVRYVITDGGSSVGRPVLDLPLAELGSLRLSELSDVNLGNYSPTEVRRVADFRSGILALHEPGFDGKRTVVTEADLQGALTGATSARLTYTTYGFQLQAETRERSLLVLPVQYSHCWSVDGGGDAQLFRADMMQLGVSFTGKVDLKLVFRYGPLLAGSCRVADLHDMAALRIAEGRTAPRTQHDE